MALSKSDRINLLIKIADRLADEDYSIIDLTLGQFRLPTQDTWNNTQRSYVLAMAKDADDETVAGLAQHLKIPFEDERSVSAPAALNQSMYVDPDKLSIWKRNCLKLFISHRDTHKAEARRLADALEAYGISAFVAHDTIEPMTTWQHEIEKGLQTMEVMLAFVTDDFEKSVWTNQEVGYALGKGAPIIPVKFEHKDPPGFIGSKQALKGQDLE